jgi:hypothetical protein
VHSIQGQPAPRGAPYAIGASVPLEVFRAFASVLEDVAVEIAYAKFAGLPLLCAEFGFEALAERLPGFRSPAGFSPAKADAGVEARARIAGLEERALERDRDTAAREGGFARLFGAVASLRAPVEGCESQALASGESWVGQLGGWRAPRRVFGAAGGGQRPFIFRLFLRPHRRC